jgi:pyruvate/2-oxoglutarate dehydrogenase complex dihydrolipoamide dehydrogenase (E3) component
MQTEIFDAIVIGTGQAGPALAARCSKAGWKTAVIERKHFGGTCVNVGCVPTKTMVASAKAMWQAQRGADYGFSIDAFHVDMARVKARKDAIVMQSRQGVENWMRTSPGVELITGHARFVGPATVEVNGRHLSARHVFINVGGACRPAANGRYRHCAGAGQHLNPGAD